MKIYIACSKKAFPSAMLLRDRLALLVPRYEFVVSANPNLKRVDIRWGGVTEFKEDTLYNSAFAVSLTANKNSFSEWCAGHGFSRVPRFECCAGSSVPTTFPVLIRTTLTGYGGAGIIPVRNEAEWTLDWASNRYWTPWVRTTKEYRVHCCKIGETLSIMRVFKKVPTGVEPDIPIRNNDNGYHFQLVEDISTGFEKLRATVAALSFLSSRFISLDVGYAPSLKDYFVFEGNSAPGLNEHTADCYANYLASELFGFAAIGDTPITINLGSV
jgi:hypothetical protein